MRIDGAVELAVRSSVLEGIAEVGQRCCSKSELAPMAVVYTRKLTVQHIVIFFFHLLIDEHLPLDAVIGKTAGD